MAILCLLCCLLRWRKQVKFSARPQLESSCEPTAVQETAMDVETGRQRDEPLRHTNAPHSWLNQLHRKSLKEVSSQMVSAASEMVDISSVISASLEQAEQLRVSNDDMSEICNGSPLREIHSYSRQSHPREPLQSEPSFPNRPHGESSGTASGSPDAISADCGEGELPLKPLANLLSEEARRTGRTSVSADGSTWFPWQSATSLVAPSHYASTEIYDNASECSGMGSVPGRIAVNLANLQDICRNDTSIASSQSLPTTLASGSIAQRSRLLTRPEQQASGVVEASSAPRGKKRWAAFISHYKVEAAMEARFLQTEIEALLGRKCFLDSDDLRDLRLLQQSVRNSDCLIVVQSKSILTRPYCLLEMVTAIEARVPIVGVSLAVGGHEMYKFELAPSFLTHLERTLEQANPGASGVLTRANVDLSYASRLLGSTIPEIISIQFNPSASRNMLAASVADVVSAMETALPMRVPTPEEWERQQAVTPVPALDWNLVGANPERSSPPSPIPSEASSWRGWPFRKRPHHAWVPTNGRN